MKKITEIVLGILGLALGPEAKACSACCVCRGRGVIATDLLVVQCGRCEGQG